MQKDNPAVVRSAGQRFLAANPAFDTLWRAKIWVVALAAALGLAVYMIASSLPTQYLGSVTIRIGEVQFNKISSASPPQTQWSQWLIEAPAVAADRFKSIPFKSEILKAAGLPGDESTVDGRMARRSMLALASPMTSVIEVQVLATTPEVATRILGAAVTMLQKAHQELSDPRIQQLRQQVNEISAEIEETKRAERDLMNSPQIGTKSSPDALGGAVAISQLSALFGGKFKLTDDRREVAERLGLSVMSPTAAVTPPSVLPEPVGPRRFLYACIAALVSLALLSAAVLLFAPIPRSTSS